MKTASFIPQMVMVNSKSMNFSILYSTIRSKEQDVKYRCEKQNITPY